MIRNKQSEAYSKKHPKRILYSQNFLKNKAQVYHLVKNSSIAKDDVVVEIGPGKGIITKFLLLAAKEVIAVEIDSELIEKLREKFKEFDNLKIVSKDITHFSSPESEYKVFSNMPFNITSEIMRKLLNYESGPIDSYLVIQLEAFRRFAGNPFAKESLVSVLNKPFFSFDIFYEFVPSDFNPVPNAKVVMARIKKRKKPLIELADKSLFEDFVTFAFLNQKARITNSLEKVFSYKQFQIMSKTYGFDIHSSVSDLNIDHWIGLFESFKTKVPEVKHRQVKGFASHTKKLK